MTSTPPAPRPPPLPASPASCPARRRRPALLAAGAALSVLFAAAAHAALGASSHNAQHAVGMHRPGAAPHLRQQRSGLRKDGGRHGPAPTTSYVPTGRQMAAPAKCCPRAAARGPSWQHCVGITRLLVPPASKALVTLTLATIRSSSGSSDQTVRQAAGNPYGQLSSVIAGGTSRAVASAARTMARNLAVTVF
jgi:hypothetical protein